MLDNFLIKFPYITKSSLCCCGYWYYCLFMPLILFFNFTHYVNLTFWLALKKKVLLNIQLLTKQQVTKLKMPDHWFLLHYRTKSLKSKIWHTTISSLSL